MRFFKASFFWGMGLLLFAACETSLDNNPSGTKELLSAATPESIQITPQDESLLLLWTRVAAAQGVNPDYDVYYSAFPEPTQAVKFERLAHPTTTTNLIRTTITGLENHKTYYVWVKCIFGSLGESEFAPMSQGIPVPPPAVPGSITVTPSQAMLVLTWDADPDAFTYEVFYRAGYSSDSAPPSSGAEMVSVSAAVAVITNLTNNTLYTVWVQAKNTAGESGYRRGVGTPGSAVSESSAMPIIKTVIPGNKKLTLSWEPVLGVPRYEVFYNTVDNYDTATLFEKAIPTNFPVVTANITGLDNGTRYYIWVKSNNSQPSIMSSGTPQAKPPIDWSNPQFELGTAAEEYIWAQTVPPSVFFPEGATYDRLTRVQETALGNLFTDGAAWYIREVLKEPIDFVFLNGGYIEGVFRKGQILLQNVPSAVRSEMRNDKLVILSLTGTELKEFFGVTAGNMPVANSVAAVTHMGRGGANTGHFGMVSQEIRYTIEYPKSPAGTSPELSHDDADKYWHGRIKAGTLKFNGADINDTKTYRICTTENVASGEYYLILNTLGKNKKLIDLRFYHTVGEYIYDQGIITPGLDGRIQLEGGVPLPPPWKNSEWNPYSN